MWNSFGLNYSVFGDLFIWIEYYIGAVYNIYTVCIELLCLLEHFFVKPSELS